MAKTKCYTPQLSREIVSQLYFKAKAERVPMRVLAYQHIEKPLGNKTRINTRRAAGKQHITQPN